MMVFSMPLISKPTGKSRIPKKPHDHCSFSYTKEEMVGFGEMNGFLANYIGEWNHPRNQVIVEYRKAIRDRDGHR